MFKQKPPSYNPDEVITRRIFNEELNKELDRRDYVSKAELDEILDKKLDEKLAKFTQRILAVLANIDTKLDAQERIEKQTGPLKQRIQNHEVRISQLEVKALS